MSNKILIYGLTREEFNAEKEKGKLIARKIRSNFNLNDMPAEIWKDVLDYEGVYKISNLGRIKSTARYRQTSLGIGYFKEEKILKSRHTRYSQILLRKNGKKQLLLLHRMVAIAFIPNPSNKPQVNHKFANKEDNRAESLEWATKKENDQHVTDAWLQKGDNNDSSILTEKAVLEIRKTYWSKNGVGSNGDELAKKFGVCKGTIQAVMRRQNWQHI